MTISERAEQEYQMVKEIVDANLNPINAETIREEVKKLTDSNEFYEYANIASNYVGIAIQKNDQEIRQVFKEVFFRDLEEHGLYFLVTLYAMALEDLYDLIQIGFRPDISKDDPDESFLGPSLKIV